MDIYNRKALSLYTFEVERFLNDAYVLNKSLNPIQPKTNISVSLFAVYRFISLSVQEVFFCNSSI